MHCTTHSCVWHDPSSWDLFVTQLMHVCVPWLILWQLMSDMTHFYARHDPFTHVTCLIHSCNVFVYARWRDACTRATCFVDICDLTRSLICDLTRSLICDVTRSLIWSRSLIRSICDFTRSLIWWLWFDIMIWWFDIMMSIIMMIWHHDVKSSSWWFDIMMSNHHDMIWHHHQMCKRVKIKTQLSNECNLTCSWTRLVHSSEPAPTNRSHPIAQQREIIGLFCRISSLL